MFCWQSAEWSGENAGTGGAADLRIANTSGKGRGQTEQYEKGNGTYEATHPFGNYGTEFVHGADEVGVLL